MRNALSLLVAGTLLMLGLMGSLRHEALPRPAAPALPSPLSPFEASFAAAQREHLRAQFIARQGLEALEEWDANALHGSAAEIYRLRLMARARETGLAEAAACEAAAQARTTAESYRAIRLLAYIEHDLGHPKAELEAAGKLVALRPHHPEALLILARARRSESAASRRLR